ncbi:hypothetical protein CR513_26931, partial [Mucuna pruriens]
MEGDDHSLVPQWLKSSGNVSKSQNVVSSKILSTNMWHNGNIIYDILVSDHITYSDRQWSSSSKDPGLSRSSYNSSERSWHDRDWEKDIDNFFHKDKLFLDDCNHDHSDYVENKLSNRFQKDLLQRSQSMNSERWRETRSPRTSGDVSSPQRNRRKSDGSVTGVVDIMLKTLGEESPILGAEDKHGNSELGRMLSSSSSTSSHNLLTGTSAVIVSNSLASASHDIPMTVGSSSKAMMMHQYNVSTSTSSITPGTMGPSMAETLAQGPPRPYSPTQLSASTQKLEELALKQSRLLIPVTPSTPRSLVASSSEKSKVKTGQQQYPYSYSRRPNNSFHNSHPNSDIQKISSGNSHNVSASRELNSVSSAAKDSLSPNGRGVLSPVGATRSTPISSPSRSLSNNSTPSAWITMEKRPSFPIQSRNDFFKNLSKKSSLEKPCSDVLPIDMPCALEKKSEASTKKVTSCPILKPREASSVDTSAMTMLTDYGSIITKNGNAANEPLKPSSSGESGDSGEKQHSSNPFPYPDEEEIAFLRSLGWEEGTGDDEGLTEEEIQDFYEKSVW